MRLMQAEAACTWRGTRPYYRQLPYQTRGLGMGCEHRGASVLRDRQTQRWDCTA